MCAICGIFNHTNSAYEVAEETILKMRDIMTHRGPDGKGIYLSSDRKLGLGHRRLSIIDLSEAGNQPMSNEDGTIWIAYNGEVYNFYEIREELEKRGHQFKSRTDTEVIVHSYEEWGEDCLHQFRGMFAFALWDERKNKLFLARDRLGIKPLYYTEVNGNFIFASELKGILASGLVQRDIEPQGLHHYLSFYSVPAPYTLIKGVKALPSGHKLVVEKGRVRIEKYWELEAYSPLQMDEEEIKERLRELLEESIRYRLISDVPVGAFLSGGVDSSLIVGLMSQYTSEPLKTFSIGYGPEDELSYAKIAAERFGTEHFEIVLSGKDLLEDLDKVIWAIDQPSGDGINSYFVSKITSQHVKVALSGLGGDELFAGYMQLFLPLKYRRMFKVWQRLPLSVRKAMISSVGILPLMTSFKRKIQFGLEFLEQPFYRMRVLYSEQEKKKLYHPEFQQMLAFAEPPEDYVQKHIAKEDSDFLAELSRIDLSLYMRYTLLRDTDAMTMVHSLETRVPLIDHKLVEFAYRIPSRLKVHKGRSKYILTETVKDILPMDIIKRKKRGFELPVGTWLKNELKPVCDEVLSGEAARKRGLFNPASIREIHQRFFAGTLHYTRVGSYMRVWTLVVLELWLRKFVDGN